MRISAPKKPLLRLIARVASTAEAKSTMHALTCIHLVAKDGVLAATATDLYVGIRGSIPAAIERSGSICLSAKDLVERLKVMPDGDVSIDLGTKDAHAATLKTAGSVRKFTLRGLSGDDFPPVPGIPEGAKPMMVPAATLRRCIDAVAFAVSDDETRAHLNGMLFELGKHGVRTVATDGHRLALNVEPVDGLPDVTALLPLKSIKELRGLLDEPGEGDVGLVSVGETFFATWGGMTLSIKTVAAQFPPYAQVIPQNTHSAKVPRGAFRDAVRAVQISSGRNGGVKVGFEAPGTVRVTATDAEGAGEGFDEVPGEVPAAATLGINPKYLMEATGALSSEEITISYTGELDPAVIRPCDLANSSESLCVIMPMLI
jgi:DNA polymerase III subunit beta